MRKYFFLFGLFLAPIAASAAETPTMCTAEYAPVCGSVQVQCITAPCYPVRQTFGNACAAGAEQATDIIQGECAPVVGGDSDEHGCKASAGYSWDPMMSACIRPWEKSDTLVKWAYGSGLTKYDTVEKYGYDRSITRQEAAAIFARAGEKTLGLRYASYPDVCNIAYTDEKEFDASLKDDIYSACAFDMMHGLKGVFSPSRTLTRAEALAIVMRAVDGGKKDESGAMWYELYADRAHELDILSFANFKGFDTPITRGELIEWIYKATQYMNKKIISSTNASALIGEWKLQSYRLDDMMFAGDAKITFEAEKYSAKFCNTHFGNYTATTSNFTVSGGVEASTRMACTDAHLSMMENGWKLDGAKYTLDQDQLTITTKLGGTYTFVKNIPEPSPLLGKWDLIEFSGATVQTGMTLEIQSDTYSAKICNTINGSYSVKDGKISAGPAMSTMMYCENTMKIEDAFSLDSATYAIAVIKRAAGSVGPSMYLDITTQKGTKFRFAR